MNKIEEMIKQLCPNGVEWKKLGEVVRTVTPPKKLKTNEYQETGEYIVVDQGQDYIAGYTDDEDSLLPLDNYVLYGDHTCIVKYVDVPFAQGADGLKILKPINVNSKYLYHAISAFNLNSTEYKRHWTQAKEISVPLPPLPIQTEIVRILDKFVEQQEQLERLIELRKKQYEYYTHKLYSDLKQKGVNIKRLGDFCDLLSGNPFDSNLMVNDGIRLMRGMNIKRGSLDFSEDLNKYWETDDGLEKYYLNRDDIVISMDGSLVGRSFAYIEEKHLPLLLVQRVARIRTNKNNSKYLYHYLANGYFAEHVDLKKTAGAIPHISMKDISSFQIPLPDIETQNAIVKTLDSFESSITALTSALEASKKRYVYYRDEVLRF